MGPTTRKMQNKNVNKIHALILNGAGDGNRTHVISLEGWSSTIELHPHQTFLIIRIIFYFVNTKIKKFDCIFKCAIILMFFGGMRCEDFI